MDRNYYQGQPPPRHHYSPEPPRHYEHHHQGYREPQVDLSDHEILSLLSTTQHQLRHQQPNTRVDQDFLATCWQLCGAGCHPADENCAIQQCSDLCSIDRPAFNQRELYEHRGDRFAHQQRVPKDLYAMNGQQQKPQQRRDLEMPSYAAVPQRTLSSSATDLIADAKLQSTRSRQAAIENHLSTPLLPEDFIDEEKVLKNRRVPSAAPHQQPELEESKEDYSAPRDGSLQQRSLSNTSQQSNHVLLEPIQQDQRSNDLLGEAFADQQASLLDEGLEATSVAVPQDPLSMSANQTKLPVYVVPLVGGLAIIAVFCAMIGLLILEPGSKEQAERKRRAAAKRKAEIKKVAAQSWTLQPERANHQVSGNQARELDNHVYKRL